MAKILIIDDDPDMVLANRMCLEGAGYQVISANNPTDGLMLAQAEKPDLIVLDVMMDTDAEGFGVAYRLEADPTTRRIPIVLLTGFMDHMAGKREAFDFITDRGWPAAKLLKKPVAAPELLATIRELLAEAESLKTAVA